MNGWFIPEQPLIPPEDSCEIAGGCGHEVYPGEVLVEWHSGRKYIEICEECFRDRVADMTTEELAAAIGCVYRTAGIMSRG